MKYQAGMFNVHCVGCQRKHKECYRHCMIYRISNAKIRKIARR